MFMEYQLTYLLMAVALTLALFSFLWLQRPMSRIIDYKKTETDIPPLHTPKVSVIVYSQVYEEELMDYLHDLCGQDYPDFEVIVVCESTAESNEMLLESCTRIFSNVYVTFIPPGSHNLSRRKLAQTLGIKAAKGEIIVTTVANAVIPSSGWLSSLVSPFRGENADNTDVSLGYSHFDYSEMHGWGKWYREFNSVMSDSLWIGYALKGMPYRGDGNNLAFRRKLFFDHKGYSQSIYLHSGDDDIFIHTIARPDNTKIVLTPESILSIEWGDASKRMWSTRKEQYEFTSRWLPRKPFLRAGAMSAIQWLVTLSLAVTIAMSLWTAWQTRDLTECAPAASALVMLILFRLVNILLYRKMAEKMCATRLWWAVPSFLLAKPILNFFFRLHHRKHRHLNFTWAR